MSLANDTAELVSRLSAPCAVESAFLYIFRFVVGSGASFGWLPLGTPAIEGFECSRQVAIWSTQLRKCVAELAPFGSHLEIAGIGRALEEIAREGAVSREASRALVIALKVLDEAFRGVHPGEVLSESDGVGYVQLRSQVRLGLPLFSGEGLVAYPKPRRVSPRTVRGQRSLSDLMQNVAVVAHSPSLRVVNLAIFSGGSPGPEGFRKIGFIPTIHSHTDLLWNKEADGRYSVREKPESSVRVHEQLRDAISALSREGADLILMPELVSSATTDEIVQEALIESIRAGAKTPHLFLAGTRLEIDGGLIRNRAVVFNCEGEIAWRQDKLHAYLFSAVEQNKAGHPLGSDGVEDRLEAIDIEPRTLYVVDISSTQRIAVLTCEDFAQPDPHASVIRDIVATTILVPVMSCARQGANLGWIHEAGVAFARHPGSTSAIVNSGALLAGRNEHWQYGHLIAEPQVSPTWTPLQANDGTVLAWLAETARLV